MGRLLLVRHGQASWGADDYDVLSPLGWEQSRLLGDSLGARSLVPDLVLHGSMRRHRETAEATLERAGWSGVEAAEDQGWNEFDHVGMLAAEPVAFGVKGPSKAEFQAWFETATDRWVSGSFDADYTESFAAFGTRVLEALRRAQSRVGPDGTAVVFTSGGPVSWVAAALLAGGPENIDPAAGRIWASLNRVVVNSSVTKVVHGSRGTTLVSFNEHVHLEGDVLTYR
ncbi:MAG: histidine phosphatase family protein [Nocardioides sp.]